MRMRSALAGVVAKPLTRLTNNSWKITRNCIKPGAKKPSRCPR